MTIHAMLPKESIARSVLGDKLCGKLIMEWGVCGDDPETWDQLFMLAQFSVGRALRVDL